MPTDKAREVVRRASKRGVVTLTGHRVPLRIYSRAMQVLNRLQRGSIYPRHTYQHGFLSLRIGHRWRLLSKDGGHHWEVMSHQRYNKELKVRA
ncbi:hypothetical protein J5069_07575 [Candidatus Symbiopectobacterium sp. NZEC127]|nr:hypothetical protein [Candidatus Symbiopectobacterium sp. NZEC127]